MNRVFVDGKVHVRSRQCATCIFRPEGRGRLLGITDERVTELVTAATADDAGSIPCHHHLYDDQPVEPVCRGFYDRHATIVLRLAAAMEVIEWVDDPPVS